MKTRRGFVSNSSTSSFIILKKDVEMSFEERKAKSIEILSKRYDEETLDDYYEEAEKYANDGKHIILTEEVEWGGEDAINKIVPALLKALNVNDEDISYDWGE